MAGPASRSQAKRQNLVIYRSVANAVPVPVVTFQGTVDSDSFIERGGCVVAQDGALWVATSLQPLGVPYVTETGFQGVWCRIPNVDAPWSLGGTLAQANAAEINRLQQIASAQQQLIEGMQNALANVAQGGLSAEDRAMLDWLRTMPR